MSDQELLERAAKAAGIPWPQNISGFQMQYEGTRPWNPLTDDGDALRLAVKLRMYVTVRHAFVYAKAYKCPSPVISQPIDGDDSSTATRRAIVCAAAAIGKVEQ